MESKTCKHISKCVKPARLKEYIVSKGSDPEHLRIMREEYCSQRGAGCMPEFSDYPQKYIPKYQGGAN